MPQMLPVETSFKTFTARNGSPLDRGYVYFGVASLNPITSPIVVYWDAEGTQPAEQPLRTENGYIMRAGAPANVYCDSDYSLLVQDARKRQVFYARTSAGFSIGSYVGNFTNSLTAPTGADQIGFKQSGIAAAVRTTLSKMRERVTVFDFMSADEIADVQSGALSLDVTTPIEAALAYAFSSSCYKELIFPAGKYRYSRMIDIGNPTLSLRGDGRNTSELCFTGAGTAVQFTDQYPNNGAFAFGGSIRHIGIRGNSTSTTLLRVKNVNHFVAEDINLRESNNASGVGLQWLGVVCGMIKDVVCSTNAQLMTNRPQNALVIGADPTTGGRATGNTVINLIAEGMIGDGVQLIGADGTIFMGGTTENNSGNGVTLAAGARMNTFLGVSFENSIGFADISDSGFSNKFINCYTKKRIYFGPASLFGKVEGGFHQDIVVDGDFATLEDLKYSFFAPGGVITIKNNTSTRNMFNASTSALTFATKPAAAVTVGASPFTYTNTSGLTEQVIYSAGGSTQVVFGRGGPVAQLDLSGVFMLAPNDTMTWSYAGTAPAVTRVPYGTDPI